jgi:AraC family L-rhamnose operon regulatory protein RhaS
MTAAEKGEVRLHALARAGYPGARLPDAELPGLCSLGSWNAAKPQTWGLPMHRNEGLEFTFLASGEIATHIEDRAERLHSNEFFFTRPWQPHQLGAPHVGASRLIWLILDVGVRRPHQKWIWPAWIILSPADLAELTDYLRQNERFIWLGTPEIRRCFLELARVVELPDPALHTSRLAVGINALLLAALEHFRTRQVPLNESLTSVERTVRHFIAELEASLEEPWTLETMAASCHLGVTRFISYFRLVTNLPPIRYLSQVRVQKACRLLVEKPERAITEIAFDCGFSSSQYFANVFTRQVGCSPRNYRKRGVSAN